MLAQQAIKCLLLSDRELPRLDTGMVHTQEGVDVVHGLRPHVREFLDLSGGVLDLGSATIKRRSKGLDT